MIMVCVGFLVQNLHIRKNSGYIGLIIHRFLYKKKEMEIIGKNGYIDHDISKTITTLTDQGSVHICCLDGRIE